MLPHSFFNLVCIYVWCVCSWKTPWHSTCVEVREQLLGIIPGLCRLHCILQASWPCNLQLSLLSLAPITLHEGWDHRCTPKLPSSFLHGFWRSVFGYHVCIARAFTCWLRPSLWLCFLKVTNSNHMYIYSRNWTWKQFSLCILFSRQALLGKNLCLRQPDF